MIIKFESLTTHDLPIAEPLSEETQYYFALCEEKLGLVPNDEYHAMAQ